MYRVIITKYNKSDSDCPVDVVIPETIGGKIVKEIGEYAFSRNQLTSVTIKGKSSKSDFTSYPSSSLFGWASGYSDLNIIWNGQ